MKTDRSNKRGDERGMIVILMAIAIVALIGAGSLAVDIGSALVTKSELQNVADASSLAATREVAVIYKSKGNDTSYKDYTLTSGEIAQINAKALAYAAANKAGGISIAVGPDDVLRGTYDVATGEITASDKGVRAVRVTGRRDDTQNGQLQTALGRVLGINQIAVSAESAAALSALGSLHAGKGEFPIGLDEDWFDTHSCETDEKITMYPTSPGSCAGWHTFDTKPASAAQLKKIVEGIDKGTFVSPETTAGKTYYEFTGGTITTAMDDLAHLWDKKKTNGSWRVNVPVYESSGCVNPNQQRLIVGFAKLDITKVKKNPNGVVEGDVECGIFDEDEVGDGGGENDFGTLVGTPGMIQ